MNKLSIVTMIFLTVFVVNAFAEAENEIPTLQQFEKSVKAQKEKKSSVPAIPTSAEMVKAPKSFVGKQFTLYAFGEKSHGFGCKAKPKPMCEFNYLNLDTSGDDGLGKKTGNGLYSLECFGKKVCQSIEAQIEGQGDSEMVVEMTDVVQMPDGKGGKVVAPLLKIIRLID